MRFSAPSWRPPRNRSGPSHWRQAISVVTISVPLLLFFGSPALATYPGRNGRILFSSAGQIFSVRPSGTGLHQLTQVPDGHSAWRPKPSADGHLVVYMSDQTGSPEVWVMHLNGTHRHRVSHDPGFGAAAPTWSPAGRIVFARCSNFLGTCRIASMRANGTQIRDITHGYWHDGTSATGDGIITVSPDGKHVAFASDRGGYNNRLWVARTDGSGLREIGPAFLGDSSPVDWSPNGSRILGDAGTQACCTAFSIRPDGHGFRVLALDTFADAYSPDGRLMLAHFAPDFTLSILHADGTHAYGFPSVLPEADFGSFTWAPAR